MWKNIGGALPTSYVVPYDLDAFKQLWYCKLGPKIAACPPFISMPSRFHLEDSCPSTVKEQAYISLTTCSWGFFFLFCVI